MQQRLFEEWQQDHETAQIVAAAWARAVRMRDEMVLLGKRAPAQDIYNRNMVSYHKTTMFHRFGGIIWWKVLIATGTVNKGMVRAVNNTMQAIIRKKANRAPTTEAFASTQGQPCPRDVEGVAGVHHM